MESELTPFDAARVYYKMGANVTAVRGKAPSHAWKELQHSRQNVDTIAGLPWSDASGVGIICGEGSGGWRCVDFDAPKDGPPVSLEVVRAFVRALGLDPDTYTWIVQSGSGRGYHVTFLSDDPPPPIGPERNGVFTLYPKSADAFDHVELRWRQHTVYPPSVHESGKRYHFLDCHDIPPEPPARVRSEAVRSALLSIATPHTAGGQVVTLPHTEPRTEQPPANDTERMIRDVQDAWKSNGAKLLVQYLASMTDGKVYTPDGGGFVRVGTEGKGFGGYFVNPRTGWFENKMTGDHGGPLALVNLNRNGDATPPRGRVFWDCLREAAEYAGIDHGAYDTDRTTEPPPDYEPEPAGADVALLDRVFIPSKANRPPDVPAVLTLSPNGYDEPLRVGSVGNITMFTAWAGVGKSAVCEALCAKAINPKTDAFGFGVSLPEGRDMVLYVDTERDTADHHSAWRRMYRRAGVDIEAPGALESDRVLWTLFTPLDSVTDRQKALFDLMAGAAFGLVIIDGAGDFIADANDPEKVGQFFDRLRAVANKLRVSVALTLHTNPRDQKGRGHAGSELMRRAESVFLVDKVEGSDVRRITTNHAYGKVRSAYDRVETFFIWDTAAGYHVGCEAPEKPQGREQEKAFELRALCSELLPPGMSTARADLERTIAEAIGGSESTAKRRVTAMIKAGMIEKDMFHKYRRTRVYWDSQEPAESEDE